MAEHLYRVFQEHFDPSQFQMVEPSAGTGSFFQLMPRGSLGYDLDPKCADVEEADFLAVTVESDRCVAMLRNPPR